MNTLLTFDATRFTRHVTATDDHAMVQFIIEQYGPALASALSIYSDNIHMRMQMHYQDAYFYGSVDLDAHLALEDTGARRRFRKRVVNEDGTVNSSKERYDELVHLCLDAFNPEVAAVLRAIQLQAKKIYTVKVLGYENRLLRILLTTDQAYIP